MLTAEDRATLQDALEHHRRAARLVLAIDEARYLLDGAPNDVGLVRTLWQLQTELVRVDQLMNTALARAVGHDAV